MLFRYDHSSDLHWARVERVLLGRESSALLIGGGQPPSTMLPLNVDRASSTACVWMMLSPRFKSLAFTSCIFGASFLKSRTMFRDPCGLGFETLAWFGWSGACVLSRNCLVRREQWLRAGRILSSWWSCSAGVIEWQPVAVLRALFCPVWMFLHCVSLSPAVQTGAT